jgi:hypothetical protein
MDNSGTNMLVSKYFVFRCIDFSEGFVTVLYNFGRVWSRQLDFVVGPEVLLSGY